jgi:hypothetical protein
LTPGTDGVVWVVEVSAVRHIEIVTAVRQTTGVVDSAGHTGLPVSALMYTPSWTACEWCDGEITEWINHNGYAVCEHCGNIN